MKTSPRVTSRTESPDDRFLPTMPAPHDEAALLHALLSSDALLRSLLDSVLGLTVVLNRSRQIVYVNEAMRRHLGIEDGKAATGQRFGNLLDCVNSGGRPSTCGTTAACQDCGANRALGAALGGDAARRPCRIRTRLCGRDLSLMLLATPLRVYGTDLIILSGVDIGDELRRRELEQLFFHDVLNTAGGVKGLIQVMQESPDPEVRAYLPIAARASNNLIEELLSQRDLAAAESGELAVNVEELRTRDLLGYLATLFASHATTSSRRVAVSADSEDLALRSDRTLLSRVLVNLVKNALEAVPRGGIVTVACRREDGRAVFTVHNPTTMPPSVQHQVFQRSFTTKGPGRGLGTYAVRLLTENYLRGTVGFTSDPVAGTVFRASFPLDA